MRISDWSSDVCSSDLRLRPWAARSEMATFRQVDRARNLAAQEEAGELPAGIGIEHRRQQRPAVGMQRRLEEQIGSAACRERVWQYVGISVVVGALTATEKEKDRNCK